jgi:ATP-dependent Clp protease ATP-binding subunit ClpA
MIALSRPAPVRRNGIRFFGIAMASPESAKDDIFTPAGQLQPDYLTDGAATVLHEALRLAKETRWESVRSPHIFMGLLSHPDAGIRAWGERLKADLTTLLGQFQELFHQETGDRDAVVVLNREFLSDNVIRVLRDAYQRALDHRRRAVTPMDLLITLLTSPNSIVAECFERIGVTAAKLTEWAVMAEQTGSIH